MLALLVAVLPFLAQAQSPQVITPATAAKHVGERIIVQGTIEQIALTVNLTTHINFGGRYPNHVFTATILKANQPLFKGVRDLEGKLVNVEGVVRLYRGKPEIVLTEPSQLRRVE
jgi:DNA/RNA endonuclease YhcR with UshA esterase domain